VLQKTGNIAAMMNSMGQLFSSQLLSLSGATLDREIRQACAVVQLCQPWFYLRLLVYGFLGLSEGHRVNTETWCHRHSPTGDYTLEPERLKNRLAATRTRSTEMDGALPGDVQEACNFSFSASKSSPFFQSVRVMAAILRASVRRAMGGLMPLASEAW